MLWKEVDGTYRLPEVQLAWQVAQEMHRLPGRQCVMEVIGMGPGQLKNKLRLCLVRAYDASQLSQWAYAERLKISPPYLNKIIHNKMESITIDKLMELCKVAGLTGE
ncbi:MAG: XRE family transcriptional regulator [Aeromonas veronii]